jgi:hypothetical protein
VECFFSVITRQAIRRGTFTSVKELTAAISTLIDHWNDHPHPFPWTKDADEILASIKRAKTSERLYRALAQPQRHAHERVDVVGQADAMVSISYVCARFLIAHEHR